MAYEIEKGIPIPKTLPPSSRGSSKYPWRTMGIGDSFFVAGVGRNTLYRTAQVHLGKGAVRIAAEGDGFRVWRKA